MRGRSKQFDDDAKNVTLRMSQQVLDRVDECRRFEPDIPTRSEMIRRLLVERLDARNVPQPDPNKPNQFLNE